VHSSHCSPCRRYCGGCGAAAPGGIDDRAAARPARRRRTGGRRGARARCLVGARPLRQPQPVRARRAGARARPHRRAHALPGPRARDPRPRRRDRHRREPGRAHERRVGGHRDRRRRARARMGRRARFLALPPPSSGGARGRPAGARTRNPPEHLASADETAAVWDEAFYPLAAGAWTRGGAGAGRRLAHEGVRVPSAAGLRARAGRASRRAAPLPAAPLVGERHRRRARPRPARAGGPPGVGDGNRRAPHAARRRAARTGCARAVRRVRARRPGRRAARPAAPLGIVVRTASFGLAGCARIAVPGPEGLERLDRARDAAAAEEGSA
jgi:hypothetical protein